MAHDHHAHVTLQRGEPVVYCLGQRKKGDVCSVQSFNAGKSFKKTLPITICSCICQWLQPYIIFYRSFRFNQAPRNCRETKLLLVLHLNELELAVLTK